MVDYDEKNFFICGLCNKDLLMEGSRNYTVEINKNKRYICSSCYDKIIDLGNRKIDILIGESHVFYKLGTEKLEVFNNRYYNYRDLINYNSLNNLIIEDLIRKDLLKHFGGYDFLKSMYDLKQIKFLVILRDSEKMKCSVCKSETKGIYIYKNSVYQKVLCEKCYNEKLRR